MLTHILKELGKFTLIYDFWLPWLFGYGQGWGCQWFDIGPFCVYWPDDTPRKG